MTPASRTRSIDNSLNNTMEITATGIDALTVRPTLSTKYSDDAPNTIPSRVPTSNERIVSSGKMVPAAMYGAGAGIDGWVMQVPLSKLLFGHCN
jgi:hypothetical protein